MMRRNDPLNVIAWRDCLLWAWDQPDIKAAFEAETGMKSASSSFNRMIDQATGFGAAIAERFISWFNEQIWGIECAPDRVREQEAKG